MTVSQKIKLALTDSILNALALALIFTWILSYPMHGPFLEEIFGPKAYILGHVFTFCHGLGLFVFAFLPPSISSEKRIVTFTGSIIWALTCIWTFFPFVNPYIISGILGLISAYLVLAWVPVFLNEENPVITIGLAMTAANLLLGLAGFTHFLSYPFIKIVASFTGLAPLLGALNISNKRLTSNLTNEEPGRINKTGIILSVIAFSAAAYFSGGLWFRVIMPLFYSRWPEVIGLDSFIYAVFYFALALYARKFSYIWLGPVALSLLGLGLATVIIGPDRPVETIITLLLLIAGLCATDLYYWLTLRGLTKMLNCRKVFGLGLGVSLFFITAPGIALDVQILPSPLSSSTTAVFGACLLFIINPLIIWFLRPLQQYEQDKNVSLNNFDEKNRGGNDVKAGGDKLDREIPAFWYDLTNTEKKVYELIYNGCTDSEISEKLVISRHTVKFHVRNILRKSGTSNRKELLQIVKASK